MKWIAYGRNAILVRFAEEPGERAFKKCRALVQALETHAPARVSEFVPGYTSLLVEFELHGTESLREAAEDLMPILRGVVGRKVAPGPLHEIPVVYDGPDLERVAEHNQISREQVIRLHAGPVYQVYLLGFSPGFPYLSGLVPKLQTPRLQSPRTRVPAGSVAIGGDQAGIYTVPSPGGWNIIGRTDVQIFNPADGSENAFLLKQGDRVRFVPVE